MRAALEEQRARLKTVAARLHAARAVDIHDARVAARRLRSLLATYRPLLDERRSRRLRRRLRAFARALSAVREADVRRDTLLALAKLEPPLAAADASRLRAALRRSCAGVRQSLRREISSRDWATAVEAICDERSLSAMLPRQDAGLAEVLELVDRPWREAGTMLLRTSRRAAELHRLRLVLKRCRYALESIASVEPGRAEETLRRLRSAQDRLGEHRDASQAREWLRANEERLGRSLARRLDRELRRCERALAVEAVAKGARVLPAYAAWRSATRALRTAPETTRGRA